MEKVTFSVLTPKPTLTLLSPQVAGRVGITLTTGANTAAVQTAVSVVNGNLHGGTSN